MLCKQSIDHHEESTAQKRSEVETFTLPTLSAVRSSGLSSYRGDVRYNSSQAFAISSCQLYLLTLALSGRVPCSFIIRLPFETTMQIACFKMRSPGSGMLPVLPPFSHLKREGLAGAVIPKGASCGVRITRGVMIKVGTCLHCHLSSSMACSIHNNTVFISICLGGAGTA